MHQKKTEREKRKRERETVHRPCSLMFLSKYKGPDISIMRKQRYVNEMFSDREQSHIFIMVWPVFHNHNLQRFDDGGYSQIRAHWIVESATIRGQPFFKRFTFIWRFMFKELCFPLSNAPSPLDDPAVNSGCCTLWRWEANTDKGEQKTHTEDLPPPGFCWWPWKPQRIIMLELK